MKTRKMSRISSVSRPRSACCISTREEICGCLQAAILNLHLAHSKFLHLTGNHHMRAQNWSETCRRNVCSSERWQKQEFWQPYLCCDSCASLWLIFPTLATGFFRPEQRSTASVERSLP